MKRFKGESRRHQLQPASLLILILLILSSVVEKIPVYSAEGPRQRGAKVFRVELLLREKITRKVERL